MKNLRRTQAKIGDMFNFNIIIIVPPPRKGRQWLKAQKNPAQFRQISKSQGKNNRIMTKNRKQQKRIRRTSE